MAKKARNTVVVPVPAASAPADLPVPHDAEALANVDFNAEADSLATAIQELGDEAASGKVSIWRILKENPRQPIYVTEMLPSEFTMKRLADDFGGGIYNVRIYAPRVEEGTGRHMGSALVKNTRVFVDGPPKIRKEELPAVVPQRSEIAELAAVMQTGFMELGKLLAQRPQEKSAIEQAKEFAGLMAAFREMMPKPEPVKQISETEALEKSLSLVARVRELAPGGDGDGGGMATLALLGRALVDAIQKNPQPAPALPPAEVPERGAAGVPPTPEIPERSAQINQPEDDSMNLILRGYVGILIDNAKSNAPIPPLAEQIFDMAPENLLRELCANDNYIVELEKINPSAKLYKAYFDKLRAELIRLDRERPAQ